MSLFPSFGVPFTQFALVALVAFFGGCATETRPVEGRDYIPPVPGTTRLAAITGSVTKEDSFFAEAKSAYVLMVDYLNVLNARDLATQPLVLAPGHRTLTCEYRHSSYVSRATFKLRILPGASCQLKFESITDATSGYRYCDFWIIDAASGTVIGERQHNRVTGGPRPVHFSTD